MKKYIMIFKLIAVVTVGFYLFFALVDKLKAMADGNYLYAGLSMVVIFIVYEIFVEGTAAIARKIDDEEVK